MRRCKQGKQDSSCLCVLHKCVSSLSKEAVFINGDYSIATRGVRINKNNSCSDRRTSWRTIYRRPTRFFSFLQQTQQLQMTERGYLKSPHGTEEVWFIYTRHQSHWVSFFFTLYMCLTKHTYQMCYAWEYLHFHIYKYCALASNSNPEKHITISSVRVHALNLCISPRQG